MAYTFSPDGRRFVSGSMDGTLNLWDADTGVKLATLEGHIDRVAACAFSADGRWIASGSWDKTLRLWDAESGDPLATLPLSSGCTAVATHPWLSRLVCGTSNGFLYRVELEGIE